MRAALASLLLAVHALAAAAAAPAPTTLPDSEVPRYLRGAEVAEWSRARILFDQGQGRLAQGTSIVNTPRAPLKGAGFETPEQAKARGEAMIKEGQAQIQRANETLARLRYTAAARFAEATKAVSETIEISSYPWAEGLLVTSLRAQKAARDAGMTQQHVLGAWNFGADGRASANADLADDLRSAWGKAQGDRTFLQAVPDGGYKVTAPATSDKPTAFSADWSPPTAANQVALVWAEVHPIDANASLVFVRVADAHTLRVTTSECFLAAARSAPAGLRASVFLRDDHSFLPRVGASGAWRLGYPRESCQALGAALLRHICLRGGRIAVPAGELLSDLLGAEPRLDDRANAVWKIRANPASPGEFQVSAQQTGADSMMDVGVLRLRVESDLPKDKPGEPAKPAAK